MRKWYGLRNCSPDRCGNSQENKSGQHNDETYFYQSWEYGFAVLCDGMGGLAKGELASATVIRAFDKWVNDDLQMICQNGPGYIKDSVIRAQWESIVANQNQKSNSMEQVRALILEPL